jgi:hypothetical protein
MIQPQQPSMALPPGPPRPRTEGPTAYHDTEHDPLARSNDLNKEEIEAEEKRELEEFKKKQ